eukprot:5352210-Amphidinium_carterae.1
MPMRTVCTPIQSTPVRLVVRTETYMEFCDAQANAGHHLMDLGSDARALFFKHLKQVQSFKAPPLQHTTTGAFDQYFISNQRNGIDPLVL